MAARRGGLGSLSELEPCRWWERRGPVAVWTPAGIWDSWRAEAAHRTELAALEVGERAAGYLDLSRGGDACCVGHGLYRRLPAKPERLGQLGLGL